VKIVMNMRLGRRRLGGLVRRLILSFMFLLFDTWLGICVGSEKGNEGGRGGNVMLNVTSLPVG